LWHPPPSKSSILVMRRRDLSSERAQDSTGDLTEKEYKIVPERRLQRTTSPVANPITNLPIFGEREMDQIELSLNSNVCKQMVVQASQNFTVSSREHVITN